MDGLIAVKARLRRDTYRRLEAAARRHRLHPDRLANTWVTAILDAAPSPAGRARSIAPGGTVPTRWDDHTATVTVHLTREHYQRLVRKADDLGLVAGQVIAILLERGLTTPSGPKLVVREVEPTVARAQGQSVVLTSEVLLTLRGLVAGDATPQAIAGVIGCTTVTARKWRDRILAERDGGPAVTARRAPVKAPSAKPVVDGKRQYVRLTEDDLPELTKMVEQNLHANDIARRFNLSAGSAQNWIRRVRDGVAHNHVIASPAKATTTQPAARRAA